MKTIQITVIDDLHQRSKELALQTRTTLKQFIGMWEENVARAKRAAEGV